MLATADYPPRAAVTHARRVYRWQRVRRPGRLPRFGGLGRRVVHQQGRTNPAGEQRASQTAGSGRRLGAGRMPLATGCERVCFGAAVLAAALGGRRPWWPPPLEGPLMDGLDGDLWRRLAVCLLRVQ